MDHMLITEITVHQMPKGKRRWVVRLQTSKSAPSYIEVSGNRSSIEGQCLMSCADHAHERDCLLGIPKEAEALYTRLNELHGYERYRLTGATEEKSQVQSAWRSSLSLDIAERNAVE